jgi:ribosomal protein S18 acetylase RimI-like enzyme
MASPRASKRSKLEAGSSNLKGSSHVTHLASLNELSPPVLITQYVPEHMLQFQSTKDSSRSFILELYSSNTLPDADFQKCYDLLRKTSQHHYEPSSRGWDPIDKKREMREQNMRYLIVRESNSVPNNLENFGYLSFQLDEDETIVEDVFIPVLYIYEVHLGLNLRGTGLGKHLIRVSEQIARATQMQKVMLSVFTANSNAESFYRALGYDVDETSPPPRRLRGRLVEPDWKCLSIRINQESEITEFPTKTKKSPKRAILQQISKLKS